MSSTSLHPGTAKKNYFFNFFVITPLNSLWDHTFWHILLSNSLLYLCKISLIDFGVVLLGFFATWYKIFTLFVNKMSFDRVQPEFIYFFSASLPSLCLFFHLRLAFPDFNWFFYQCLHSDLIFSTVLFEPILLQYFCCLLYAIKCVQTLSPNFS